MTALDRLAVLVASRPLVKIAVKAQKRAEREEKRQQLREMAEADRQIVASAIVQLDHMEHPSRGLDLEDLLGLFRRWEREWMDWNGKIVLGGGGSND